MENVRQALRIAKEKGLFCCLYDEDRWPSGYGGGKVTMHREYRSRNILITPYRKGTRFYDSRSYDSMASASPQGNGRFLAAYCVELTSGGTLERYERLFSEEEGEAQEQTGKQVWYVYLEIAHDSPWFNNQSYVDSLNKEAIRKFLDVTHEKYKAVVGEEFGKVIPSIFTDEPQFGRKHCLGTAHSKEEIMLPFTDDFTETYRKKYGQDLLDYLPEVLWELPGNEVSRNRYWYHDHVTERFAEAFSDQVGEWCSNNGICLAGHMMEEPTLQSQTQALGEVMRSLRGFTLPGIDMLCDAKEYTTAKQAQSICHQYGRNGVVSELYGVTNWDFDFRRHKLQGDWQAALGITHRVHHLNWMSMGGEAKRDYPAAIGFQSPWYKEYKTIETHFARVNTALRRGEPIVKIGVIHPVESCWILYGPNQQTGLKRQELDQRFQEVTEWLLFANLDFDYISESLLPEQWDGKRVGEMQYDVIIVPGCLMMRQSTLRILQEMKKIGKEIIFMGAAPFYIDARIDRKIECFAAKCIQIEFSKAQLLDQLQSFRTVEIRFLGDKHLKKPNHKKNWNGEFTEKYLYQMRQEGTNRWLFIANGRKQDNQDLVRNDDVRVELNGLWMLTELETLTGTICEKEVEYVNGNTVFAHRFYEHDSLLLFMRPHEERRNAANHSGKDITVPLIPHSRKDTLKEQWNRKELFCETPAIKREECNVLVMDMAGYQFETDANFKPDYRGPEEILRIDNKLREKLKLPPRRAALAQPWTSREVQPSHIIKLKYSIVCMDEIANVQFAMEAMDHVKIYLDGKQIDNKNHTGHFVDASIQKISIPTLGAGTHELILVILFDSKVNLENCYLLGDFSVDVCGCKVMLRKEQKIFGWSSLTEQGMPFYGGNVVYKLEQELGAGLYRLQISKYRAPLLEVRIDGMRAGLIIGSPYFAEFAIKRNGLHKIEIRCFGSRVNTFGALHDCDENEIYFDPNAWRTEDDSWSYEYQLKKTGILKAPVLYKKKET
ncbi:MAG: glycosyl hydrolase [Hespellia sp.]|nr:glycosyl hydrolase [Hespellia sp.]